MTTYPVYLHGEFVTGATSFPVRNPATGEPFARMSSVDAAMVAQALTDAHAAFLGWRRLPGKARGDHLRGIADRLERRQVEMAETITRENGKPVAQSRAEVALACDHLRWFAEEARRGYGRIVPPQVEGKRHLVLKTPVGVVGAISPWNFPLMLAVRKVAPALAAGCAVVLKPARATPLSAVLLAECVHEAGLPTGVFQLVAGQASEIGAAFLDHPLCRKITFTGSTAVGRQLIAGAARQAKPLALELGGCAPLLVFGDADLGQAVEGTLLAKFRNSGQSCIAANRIYVHRPVYAEFVERLAARVRAFKVGNGLEPEVDVGPLIDEAALAGAAQQVEDALARGARLLCGGMRMPDTPGFFFAPTVLADVPEGSLCFREETFAPIAPVSVFDFEEEALERANASPYGLSAYAFTSDLGRAFRLMEQLEAGIVGINDGLPTVSHCPFGGVKQSGWGRELGAEGLDAFLDTRHVSLAL